MIVSVVIVLQRIEGLSDREAVDRFSFDARWKYAAGGLAFGYPGFVHMVLVDMRARLARRTGRIGSLRSRWRTVAIQSSATTPRSLCCPGS